MTLGDTQREFTLAVGKLILYTYGFGYELTFGDAYRDKRVHGEFNKKKSYSAGKSVHKIRLAVDFNLFVSGVWIQDGEHEAWKELGEYWKTLHALARWGGDFKDANHFSFTYWGCK